jgi:Fic family protein
MIKVENFKSGEYGYGYEYKFFIPNFINEQWSWEDQEINKLLEKAAVKLGELNSYARLVPNIDLFIQLHVSKEAVISSKIEGTQTNIGETFLPQNEIALEKRNDWKEVNNYINALNSAIEMIKTIPISTRIFKFVHKKLLDSVRGEHKLPGEFRSSQNWIGGQNIKNAVFIPPQHNYISDLMSDLEHFLHNEKINVPALIRIAIAHYQFETIHPFLDGNGRIGRLMITLYLVSIGLLDKPLLYLSVFFESNKQSYYDNLTYVRTKSDMLTWIKYFLVGVEKTAQDSVNTLSSVLSLKASLDEMIYSQFGKRSHKGIILLQSLFQNPVTTIDKVTHICGITFKSASGLVKLMVDKGILIEQTGQQRNRIFTFQKYLNIFE